MNIPALSAILCLQPGDVRRGVSDPLTRWIFIEPAYVCREPPCADEFDGVAALGFHLALDPEDLRVWKC